MSAVTADRVRELLGQVVDPEIPVLTLEDLGVLRDVTVDEDGGVTVVLTPTYSGCPATEVMRADVRRVLAEHGLRDVEVRTVLSPAWTTDWMTERGRRRLEEFGVAPPGRRPTGTGVPVDLGVRCPRCGSVQTRMTSRFGSTACKALYVCAACDEPFDHFKAI